VRGSLVSIKKTVHSRAKGRKDQSRILTFEFNAFITNDKWPHSNYVIWI